MKFPRFSIKNSQYFQLRVHFKKLVFQSGGDHRGIGKAKFKMFQRLRHSFQGSQYGQKKAVTGPIGDFRSVFALEEHDSSQITYSGRYPFTFFVSKDSLLHQVSSEILPCGLRYFIKSCIYSHLLLFAPTLLLPQIYVRASPNVVLKRHKSGPDK